MPDLSDIVAKAKSGGDFASIKEFDGKTLDFVSYEVREGTNGPYLIIDALSDGDDVKIRTGAQQVVQVLQGCSAAGLLPVTLKVTSFPTQHGTRGYSLEEV